MISDILEIANTLAPEDFLVIADIEKTFDSVNHWFLLPIFWELEFGMDFVSWVETILKNQKSWIINWGKTTKYFKLERGGSKEDLMQMTLISFSKIEILD